MTLTSISTLIDAFVAAGGQAYITSSADKYALINEMIGWYAEETLTFFDPRVTLTTIAGVQSYDVHPNNTTVTSGATSATQTLGSTAGLFSGGSAYFNTLGAFKICNAAPASATSQVFTTSFTTVTNEVVYNGQVNKRVVLPVNVAVVNTVLTDFLGNVGPISSKEWHNLSTAYGASNAVPTRWTFEPPSTIRFDVPCSAVHANTYVSGFVIPHPLINTTDEVALPDECERELAMFVAARMMDPRAAGSSMEKAQWLDKVSFERFQERKKRAAAMMMTIYRGDQNGV